MNELQIKDIIQGILNSMSSGDDQHMLSFVAEDIIWASPQGTFKGIEQAGKYLTWIINNNKDYKITVNGIGIIVQGNTAVSEHEFSGIFNGLPWKAPAVCTWEFKEDKVQSINTYFDVLTQAQQLAKGVEKVAVNSIVNASRKGL
jgi:ketosteroid isomerase-like protein